MGGPSRTAPAGAGDAERRTVRLPGGRVLGYAEYGDPRGAVLISCHGGLSSRLDIRGCDAAARAAGVRVISPDRPGVGLSPRQPGRSLLDWPADVAGLADALGVERFMMLGWSAGGPYAAACAFALPGRVSTVGLVASSLPPSAATGDTSMMDRLFTYWSVRAPWADRIAFRAMGGLARLAPATFHALALMALDKPSRALVRGVPPALHSGAIAEGLRDPAGVVDEYRILGSEWGFAPEEISQPVQLWQGDADNFVPAGWSDWLAARIPHARLTRCPGEGHFLALARYPEIFTALLAAA